MKVGDLVSWEPISELAPARGRVARIENGTVHVTVEYRNLRGVIATGEVSFDPTQAARLKTGGRS